MSTTIESNTEYRNFAKPKYIIYLLLTQILEF